MKLPAKGAFGFLLVLFFSFNFVSATGLYDGLGAYYAFDEGSGSVTNMSNYPTLTPLTVNDTDMWTGGILGNSLSHTSSFGAGAYSWGGMTQNTSLGQDVNSEANFSISFWLYRISSAEQGHIYDNLDVFGRGVLIAINNSRIEVFKINAGTSYANRTTGIIPVSVEEWTHVVVVSDNFVTKVYINGQLSPLDNIGGFPTLVGTGSNDFFVGSSHAFRNASESRIDEMAIWPNRILTEDEIEDLYNNGNALPYESFSLEPPTLIGAGFDDIFLNYNENYSIYTGLQFSDYTELCIAYFDAINNVEVRECSTGETVTYTSSVLDFTISYIDTDNFKVKFTSKETDLFTTLNIIARNALGSLANSIDFTISESVILEEPPSLIGSFVTPITLGANDTLSYYIPYYFSNYDNFTIYFYDPYLNQDVILNETYSNYTTDVVNISKAGGYLFVYSRDSFYQVNLTIQARNIYGQTSAYVDVIIDPTFGLVYNKIPQIINTDTTINMNSGDNFSLVMSNYFTNFTSFRFVLYDNNNANYLGGNTIYTNDYLVFKMEDYGSFITAKNLSGQYVFYVYARNNYGDTSLRFVININAGSYPTAGQQGAGYAPLVSFFDGLFPDADSLTLRQRFAYVIFTMLVLSLVVMLIGYWAENIGVSIFIALLFDILLFIYFIAIHYIPLIVVIVLGLIAAFIAYLIMRGQD